MRMLFLSHGGGPLPVLGDQHHAELVKQLRLLAEKIHKPSAILVISAHWEAPAPTITAHPHPGLVYDYYGFPDAAYAIQYPCPGEPALARQTQAALVNAGFEAQLDEERGLDHGVFVPLKIMYPDADIPCVQLSLLDSLDPAEHLRMGRALSTLAGEELLVIGSGFSFHNMQAFFSQDTEQTKTMNEQFEAWLIDTCTTTSIDEAERARRLENWAQAPFARYCHPREEHLLPLLVCYGLANRAGEEAIRLNILGKKASLYLW
ncbi:DODA-type extradiol aromatic ring-opening family dioxygenase [Porticoccus sp.]